MKVSSVKVFLETMCEYNTVNIQQVFASEAGPSLSVRCLHGTTTFEITRSDTQEVILYESIDQTADYIIAFVASYDLSKNS